MDNKEIFNLNKIAITKKEFFFCDTELNLTHNTSLIEGSCININEIDYTQVILLVNELDIDKILRIEHINEAIDESKDCRAEGTLTIPMYLYYDKDIFEQFVSSYDITDICKKYRMVIIVGETTLIKFFSQWDVITPTNIYGRNHEKVYDILQGILQEKTIQLQNMLAELITYYDEEEENILNRIRNKKQKICIMKYYYEHKRFKYLYRQFKVAAEKVGCEAKLCMERGNIYHTPDIVSVYVNRPDMVFQINKTRNGKNFVGQSLNLQYFDKLLYVNWIQDIHPAVLNAEYALALTNKDYVFSLFDKDVMDKYCFDSDKVILGGIMGADENNFCYHEISNKEHEMYDCDIAFAGTILTDEEVANFIYSLLSSCFNDEQIGVVADSVFEMIQSIYDADTGKYTVSADIYKKIDLLQNEMEFDYNAKMNIHRVYSVVRYNSIRKLVMQQLAKSGKYKINLYGEYDINVPGVKFGGYIDDKVELSKALQCSKMVVQINPDASMNQRVIEGLLSHTMALVLQIEKGSDMSDIHNYLNEEEGICSFHSKQELFALCDMLINDNELREKIAEKGYKKAVNTLTTDAIFGSFIDELSKKIQ